MGYKKVDSVPCLVISCDTASIYQCLSAKEKDIVWDSVMNYVDNAKYRNSEDIEPHIEKGLSKLAYKVHDSLIEDISKGFSMYWEKCEKNSAKTKKRWSNKNESEDGNDQPILQVAEKNNLHYLTYPTYTEQILNSDKRDEFTEIINTMKSAGFAMSESQINDIARKIKFGELDKELALHCIDICQKREMIDLGYFLNCVKNINENGWDGRVI